MIGNTFNSFFTGKKMRMHPGLSLSLFFTSLLALVLATLLFCCYYNLHSCKNNLNAIYWDQRTNRSVEVQPFNGRERGGGGRKKIKEKRHVHDMDKETINYLLQ